MSPDLTPKQQSSEAIRQAETILIITGQHPNIDQVASTLALAAVLRKFGKNVTALITDTLPQQVNFLDTNGLDRSLNGLRDFILKVDVSKATADKLRYETESGKLNIYVTPSKGGFAPSDVTFGYGPYRYDLAIVLGVPTRARLDRVYSDNAALFANLPIVNLDFHRSNEGYGAINLIESNASSLSEMLVALAESLQNGLIDEDIATSLLTGLMASTDRFTAAHTTAKSLTVAAQLLAAGAKQPLIVRSLFRDSRAAQLAESRGAQPAPRHTERPAAPTPKPEPVAAPDVVAELHGPIAAAPTNEPIIEPAHFELSQPQPAPESTQPDIPQMADFSAAAQVLTNADKDQSQA